MIILINILAAPYCYSQYTIEQITNEIFRFGEEPQISDNGYILWRGTDETNTIDSILLYDGNSIQRIGDGVRHHLSSTGFAVWESDGEIILYDGSSTLQLGVGWDAQVNSNGHVTWLGSSNSVYLYDGSAINIISANSRWNQRLQLNDNDYVVWDGEADTEIFLYNGSTVIQLTDNATSDRAPKINNNGDVAWQAYDGSSYQVLLYNGASTTQLTNNIYNNVFDEDNLQITDSGYLVWASKTGSDISDFEIFLYNGSSTIQLTDNSYYDGNPRINDNGHVVWVGFKDGDDEIFFFDGYAITQLTNNTYPDLNPRINSSGDIVWNSQIITQIDPHNYEFKYDVFHATPSVVPGPVRINASPLVYYTSLMVAYDQSMSGDSIQSQSLVFNEDLYIDENKSVTLVGGYDHDYTNIDGKTILNGSMIINNGIVVIENYSLE